MGQSVTIAVPKTWTLTSFVGFFDPVARAESALLQQFDGQLQITGKDFQWTLVLNEASDQAAFAEEYASNDDLDERLRKEAASLRFFILSFGDLGVTRRVLRAVAESAVRHAETAWFDTDYGWVIRAGDFLERTDRDELWDWRTADDVK